MVSGQNRLLLCDDDVQLAKLTSEYLEAKGFDVSTASNAIDGYKMFSEGRFDMCILDVKMPMKTGFELASDIREVDAQIPIIFLTAESDTEKRIEGLMIGADDYLTKPFSFRELFLRITAIFKRIQAPGSETHTIRNIGKYQFNVETRTLIIDQTEYRLSDIEAQLLEAFCRTPNGRVTRDHLLSTIWQDDDHLKSRSLNVYVSKLRKRLALDPSIEILNIHGSGYHMVIT